MDYNLFVRSGILEKPSAQPCNRYMYYKKISDIYLASMQAFSTIHATGKSFRRAIPPLRYRVCILCKRNDAYAFCSLPRVHPKDLHPPGCVSVTALPTVPVEEEADRYRVVGATQAKGGTTCLISLLFPFFPSES